MFEYALLLFHFPEEHSTAKATFDKLYQLHPTKTDHKFIAKVYLHYYHRDWAREVLLRIPVATMDTGTHQSPLQSSPLFHVIALFIQS